MAWSPTDPDEEEIDRVLQGRLFPPLRDVWRALGIQKSSGFELLRRGEMVKVKIGGRSEIPASSFRQYARKVLAKAEPPLRRPG